MPVCFEKKNIDVFVRNGVYTKQEAVARGEIALENYTKIINIEALTMLDMAKQDIIPAVSDYVATLGANLNAKKAACANAPAGVETALIEKLATLNDELFAAVNKLESDLSEIDKDDVKPASQAMAHKIVPDMQELRKAADAAEKLTASAKWPYPSYSDMLYRVK